MSGPQLPKYQAIYASLRDRIIAGEWAPGSRLPAQQELADGFGVTLMTLRQALASLEADGLVWAARGRGTFVADRPVDISVGNLSSFAQQMHSSGVDMCTETLDSSVVAADHHPAASAALGLDDQLCCITRRRSVDGVAISLQRSYLDPQIVSSDFDTSGNSLYDAIETATGWVIDEARESITAVIVDGADADLVDVGNGHPALLSIRTSINQFGQAFLYDEALLVAGRCVLTADRRADRMTLHYGMTDAGR